MIKCYKDPKDKEGVRVELDGNKIDLTAQFVCIAAKLMHSGIPVKILQKSIEIAEKHKDGFEWENENDKS